MGYKSATIITCDWSGCEEELLIEGPNGILACLIAKNRGWERPNVNLFYCPKHKAIRES